MGGDSSTHRSAGRWVQNKKTVTSGARTKYILSGFLICDHCKSRFVLVDKKGDIRGYYSGTEEEELKRLASDVKRIS